MPETQDGSQTPVIALLMKLVELDEQQAREIREQNDLAKRRTETTTNLADFSSKTAANAELQTGMARERTALTREQTRLSTRSTELANIRTELAHERTAHADERTRLATQRTEMARHRTSMSEARTKLAALRNKLAEDRTDKALTRTRLSLQRTELAKGRTSLALIRTGLAFLTLGVTFFRAFGLSWWSLFDSGLVVFSSLMVYFGTRGYYRSRSVERKLVAVLAEDPATPALLDAGSGA